MVSGILNKLIKAFDNVVVYVYIYIKQLMNVIYNEMW